MSRGAAVTDVAAAEWDETLAELGVNDAYFQRGYVEAAAVLDAGTPRLLRAGGVVFAAVERQIPGGGGLVDLTTPYGYGGPVGPGDAASFYAAYDAWARERGAVTTFVRFHPVLGNAELAPAGIRRERVADTATWPLAGDDDLEAEMHSMHRRGARKALRAGVGVVRTDAPASLDRFAAPYAACMRHRNAERFYLFPEEYWRALERGLRERLVLLEAWHDGELVASLLLLATPPLLHYHLGATSERGFALGASKLLFLEAARLGRERGFAELHLGSGLGGREDFLWQFKQRFSRAPGRPFWIGKLVHDEAAYRRLAGGLDVDGWFPAYRAPAAVEA